jgi:putative sterol carrier protein
MRCKECGSKVSSKDRYCVYCAKRFRLVPTWAKWTSVLLAFGIVIGVLVYLLLRHGGGGQPDLVIQDMALSPTDPTAGEEVIFTVTVNNQGDGNSGSSNVSFFVDASLKDSKYADPIANGGVTTVTFTWAAQRGAHKVSASVDHENSIVEEDETNNQREVALEVSVTVQFHLTGAGGGDWYAVCQNGVATRHEGIAAKALITVTMSAADWAAVQRHELSPSSAWSSGRLTVDGDLMLLLQLESAILKIG